MCARRFASIRSVGLAALVLGAMVACGPARGATATPAAAATTQPENPYFPTGKGTTWKYLVTVEVDQKPERPYVQTLTAGGPVSFKGMALAAIGDDLYAVQADGVSLVGRRSGADVAPLPEPVKVLPAKLRTSETWNATATANSAYSTCLGSQPIKTGAGEFQTQCVVVTGGGDGEGQRQAYAYFARNVGLVRETVTETTPRADGSSTTTRRTTRDLVAFAPAADGGEGAKPAAAKKPEPINTDSVRGEVLDPAGQPMAQASLTLRRLDKAGSTALQTDVFGRFASGGLDPAGAYAVSVSLPGYEPAEVALRSTDGKPASVTVQLKDARAAGPAVDPNEDAFTAGRRLAASGDHAGAMTKYAEALKRDPRNSSVLSYQALSRLALGQTREAQQDVEDALKLDDKNPLTWEAAGQVKVAQNQPTQARALFDKAAQLSPKTAGAMYTDLAAALGAKNDPKLAGDVEGALKAAAGAEPASAEALFQLGQGYANAGKQEGKAYLQRYLDAVGKLPEGQRDAQKVQVAKQLIRALDVLKSVQQ